MGRREGMRLIDQLGSHVELEQTRLIDTPGVTHITYRVVKQERIVKRTLNPSR